MEKTTLRFIRNIKDLETNGRYVVIDLRKGNGGRQFKCIVGYIGECNRQVFAELYRVFKSGRIAKNKFCSVNQDVLGYGDFMVCKELVNNGKNI